MSRRCRILQGQRAQAAGGGRGIGVGCDHNDRPDRRHGNGSGDRVLEHGEDQAAAGGRRERRRKARLRRGQPLDRDDHTDARVLFRTRAGKVFMPVTSAILPAVIPD